MDIRVWLGPALIVGILSRAIWRRWKNPVLRPILLLRSVVGALFVGLTFWVAFGIDGGVFRGQLHDERMLLVTVMMLSMMGGVVTICSITWLRPGDTPLPFRALGWTALAMLGLIALLELGRFGELRYGVYHERPFWAVLGLALIAMTLIRPWWFWEHPKAVVARGIVGNRGTIVLYLAIASFFLWFAAVPRWSPRRALKSSAGSFKGDLRQCLELAPGRSDSLGFPGAVAWQPGFETGFALWMSRTPPFPLDPQALRDTIRTTAFDGRWYRIGGDSLELRFTSDQREGMARLVVAPGPFPRTAYLEADPATFGDPSQGGNRILQTRVDSVSCRVEIR